MWRRCDRPRGQTILGVLLWGLGRSKSPWAGTPPVTLFRPFREVSGWAGTDKKTGETTEMMVVYNSGLPAAPYLKRFKPIDFAKKLRFVTIHSVVFRPSHA